MTDKFDIIFMDHMMPEMDGVEATGIIRSLSDGETYYKNVPIIALTANAVSGMKQMFLQHGMSDFLSKPIELIKLNEILEKWIPKHKREEYIESADIADTAPVFEINGVNVDVGLKRVGGNKEYYLKVLKAFYIDGKDKITTLKNCLESNNIKLYTTYVHAIKSAASNIGALTISDFAKSLEQAGHEQDVNYIRSATDKFLSDLNSLLNEINTTLNISQDISMLEDADSSFLTEKLLELKSAFENFEFSKADNILSEINSKKLMPDIIETFQSISQNVLMYEYDEATKELDELLELLSIY